MAEQGLAARERQQQIFGATSHRGDGGAFEGGGHAGREGKAQIGAVERHMVDAGAFEPGLQPPADGFDLG